MKRIALFALLGLLAITTTASESENDLALWYERPAKEWVEALPIGNGSLGAMVFGGVEKERIQFNEDTLWTGVPRDYINPKALETLPKVRRLLFEGKQKEAERTANDMMSVPLRQEAYQPFGDIVLEFPGHENYTDYRRELDLNKAMVTVQYKVGDVTFKREIFSSYPDNAIVMRISADKPGQVSCNVSLTSPHKNSDTGIFGEGNSISNILSGKLDDYKNDRTQEIKPSILNFASILAIRPHGGVPLKKETMIQNADSVTLKLCAATSFKNFRDIGENPVKHCVAIMNAIAGQSFDELFQKHLADFQNLFGRVSIDLGDSDASHQPTDVRIKKFADRFDPQLVELYFQYGRYLLISSSRPGSQPANLQGIWNQELAPPWDSKWTTNINTEMNYWPAEMCALSECHEPLFDMLDDLVVTGGKVAKEHYNCRGWVFHHNTDLWRGAAPINASNHGIWMTGGAWLCQHLWMHYAYTQDAEFLKNRAYPVMKEAAEFFVDFLIEDPKTGWLISTPSNSPENGGLVAGPTMDHQIVRNLFTNCIEASRVLGVDEDFRETLIETKKRIAPNQIGQYGQLQEWLEDKDDPNNKHRHVSHLWGLHPGAEITPLSTPELADACKVTLSHRGDGGTGWSKAWKVNFWARLHDGDRSYKMLTELIANSTLPNMFDTHPPFQIDGNFGGTSGITEMILQSHTGEIQLLPALPEALKQGSVKGLRARGGFEIDLEWKEGELLQSALHSLSGNAATLRYGNKTKTVQTETGKTYTFNSKLELIKD